VLDFPQLAHQCAPAVHANTLAHVVQVESGYNPYAIGVVGAHLERQPRNRVEAVATADWLAAHHFNYSVGLGQVNQSNFAKYGLTVATAFEPCRNLQAAAAILTDCYLRAYQMRSDEQPALRDAFSCYYSGNFTTGYKVGYVIKVVMGKSGTDHRRAEDRGHHFNPASVTAPAQGSKEPLPALVF
jgi:type IV secretion system protein VirB1